MPMREDQPTFRIADGLGQVRIWELVERRVTLTIECVSCHRRASWPPDLLRRLKVNQANRLVGIAGRIRCAACRSRYVRIGREPPPRGPGGLVAPPENRPRGLGPEHLDANARGAGRMVG